VSVAFVGGRYARFCAEKEWMVCGAVPATTYCVSCLVGWCQARAFVNGKGVGSVPCRTQTH
jgi:hypothetical protein